jgi:hypothetical protein
VKAGGLMEILCGYVIRVPRFFILNLQLQFADIIVNKCHKLDSVSYIKLHYCYNADEGVCPALVQGSQTGYEEKAVGSNPERLLILE